MSRAESDRDRWVASVRGRVQGVGFRWYVVREARSLDLDGWVANLGDGSVEVVAEGPPENLERLVGALRDGPPGASVDGVSVQREPARGQLSGFTIRSGGHRGD